MHTVALMNNGRLSWRRSRLCGYLASCGWRWVRRARWWVARGADE